MIGHFGHFDMQLSQNGLKLFQNVEKIHTSRCPYEGQTQAMRAIFSKFVDLNQFWNFFFYFHDF